MTCRVLAYRCGVQCHAARWQDLLLTRARAQGNGSTVLCTHALPCSSPSWAACMCITATQVSRQVVEVVKTGAGGINFDLEVPIKVNAAAQQELTND